MVKKADPTTDLTLKPNKVSRRHESGNFVPYFHENSLKNGVKGVFLVLPSNCVTRKWLGRGMCFAKDPKKMQVKVTENALFTLVWGPK